MAELEEAVQKERAENGTSEKGEGQEEQIFHCSRCKAVMKKGVCPVCGHTMYVGMSEKGRKKIRRIVTVAALVIFAVMFLILQLK